jgi:hypothetical protein
MECRNCLKYNGKACEVGLSLPCGEYVPHIITPLERAGDLVSRSRARYEFEQYFTDSDRLQHDCDSLLCMLPAVDAVPVVRCKDCKYNGDDEECPLLSMFAYTSHDGFCSYGERKEE